MTRRRGGNWKTSTRLREILGTVKPLAAEYYRLTGKPLGVTGEVAEYVAPDLLKLETGATADQGLRCRS